LESWVWRRPTLRDHVSRGIRAPRAGRIGPRKIDNHHADSSVHDY
jgi:hypothetical protein